LSVLLATRFDKCFIEEVVLMFTIARWCLILVFFAAAQAGAQDLDRAVAEGRERFIDACAFCHGLSGKGQGMAAHMLANQPADLTQLSRKNEGTFPLASVYSVIDGRLSTSAHGGREMPVWGDVWKTNVPSQYAEQYVRGRILELVLYLESIQEQ
jgi:mono/diheme cytochrome c family protein